MMKFIPNVTGSATQAVPLVVGKDTVYVHTNIQKVNKIDELGNYFEIYEYYEIQYDKDEYIALMSNKLNVGLADSDAINIDQEYRLTLLELGV